MKGLTERIITIVLTVALVVGVFDMSTVEVQAANNVSIDFQWSYDGNYHPGESYDFGNRIVKDKWGQLPDQYSSSITFDNQYDQFLFDLGRDYMGHEVDSIVINVGYLNRPIGIRVHSTNTVNSDYDKDKRYIPNQSPDANGNIVIKPDFTGDFRYIGFMSESVYSTTIKINKVTVNMRGTYEYTPYSGDKTSQIFKPAAGDFYNYDTERDGKEPVAADGRLQFNRDYQTIRYNLPQPVDMSKVVSIRVSVEKQSPDLMLSFMLFDESGKEIFHQYDINGVQSFNVAPFDGIAEKFAVMSNMDDGKGTNNSDKLDNRYLYTRYAKINSIEFVEAKESNPVIIYGTDLKTAREELQKVRDAYNALLDAALGVKMNPSAETITEVFNAIDGFKTANENTKGIRDKLLAEYENAKDQSAQNELVTLYNSLFLYALNEDSYIQDANSAVDNALDTLINKTNDAIKKTKEAATKAHEKGESANAAVETIKTTKTVGAVQDAYTAADEADTAKDKAFAENTNLNSIATNAIYANNAANKAGRGKDLEKFLIDVNETIEYTNEKYTYAKDAAKAARDAAQKASKDIAIKAANELTNAINAGNKLASEVGEAITTLNEKVDAVKETPSETTINDTKDAITGVQNLTGIKTDADNNTENDKIAGLITRINAAKKAAEFAKTVTTDKEALNALSTALGNVDTAVKALDTAKTNAKNAVDAANKAVATAQKTVDEEKAKTALDAAKALEDVVSGGNRLASQIEDAVKTAGKNIESVKNDPAETITAADDAITDIQGKTGIKTEADINTEIDKVAEQIKKIDKAVSDAKAAAKETNDADAAKAVNDALAKVEKAKADLTQAKADAKDAVDAANAAKSAAQKAIDDAKAAEAKKAALDAAKVLEDAVSGGNGLASQIEGEVKTAGENIAAVKNDPEKTIKAADDAITAIQGKTGIKTEADNGTANDKVAELIKKIDKAVSDAKTAAGNTNDAKATKAVSDALAKVEKAKADLTQAKADAKDAVDAANKAKSAAQKAIDDAKAAEAKKAALDAAKELEDAISDGNGLASDIEDTVDTAGKNIEAVKNDPEKTITAADNAISAIQGKTGIETDADINTKNDKVAESIKKIEEAVQRVNEAAKGTNDADAAKAVNDALAKVEKAKADFEKAKTDAKDAVDAANAAKTAAQKAIDDAKAAADADARQKAIDAAGKVTEAVSDADELVKAISVAIEDAVNKMEAAGDDPSAIIAAAENAINGIKAQIDQIAGKASNINTAVNNMNEAVKATNGETITEVTTALQEAERALGDLQTKAGEAENVIGRINDAANAALAKLEEERLAREKEEKDKENKPDNNNTNTPDDADPAKEPTLNDPKENSDDSQLADEEQKAREAYEKAKADREAAEEKVREATENAGQKASDLESAEDTLDTKKQNEEDAKKALEEAQNLPENTPEDDNNGGGEPEGDTPNADDPVEDTEGDIPNTDEPDENPEKGEPDDSGNGNGNPAIEPEISERDKAIQDATEALEAATSEREQAEQAVTDATNNAATANDELEAANEALEKAKIAEQEAKDALDKIIADKEAKKEKEAIITENKTITNNEPTVDVIFGDGKTITFDFTNNSNASTEEEAPVVETENVIVPNPQSTDSGKSGNERTVKKNDKVNVSNDIVLAKVDNDQSSKDSSPETKAPTTLDDTMPAKAMLTLENPNNKEFPGITIFAIIAIPFAVIFRFSILLLKRRKEEKEEKEA